jgi:mitogen-activated protein kinase kinase kinase 4
MMFAEEAGWKDRVQYAVAQLENQLNTQMKNQRLIGSVSEQHNVDRVHIKARSVTFSWQRGIKIGEYISYFIPA